LRDRFGIVARLEFYTALELQRIVSRSAGLLKVEVAAEGALEIARRSRGTPRIANRLLRRVRDYAEVKAKSDVSREVADAALQMLDVDALGLDMMDRKLLRAVIEIRRRSGGCGQSRPRDRRGARYHRGRDRALPHHAGLFAAHLARARRHRIGLSPFRPGAAAQERKRRFVGWSGRILMPG
jgi:hypothetical protein